MIKTIIFDFDGTIADTFLSSIEIINSLAEKYGFKKFESNEIEKLRSKSMREIIKERHISVFKLPIIVNTFTSLAQRTIISQKPINNVVQVLAELKNKGYELNIISSNSIENISIFLNNHHLNYFDHIYSDKSIFGKDIIITNFIKEFNIIKENAIYVGDEIRDIEAAHKSGLKIISVTWGFNSKNAFKAYSPDFLINTPLQLIKVLNTI